MVEWGFITVDFATFRALCQGHRSKVKIPSFFVFLLCMILRLPRTVLSLEQGLTSNFVLLYLMFWT